MIRHLCFVALIFLWFNPAVFAQQDAEKILNGVIKSYQRVSDYQVDLKINAKIPFINILPMNARMYFKQPGHIKLESKGIAILPRQGFDEMYKAITDRKSYTVVSQGMESMNGSPASIISILPLSDTMEVIHGKFWIDPEKNVIVKSQMTTRTNGTVIATYLYGTYAEYGLPDQMSFLVDVRKFKIPKTVSVDLNNYNKQQEKSKEEKKGRIDISLSNYIINKGVPDVIFKNLK